MTDLIDKLHRCDATVAIVGLGYVGLPLAVEAAEAGFTTVGIDLSQDKLDRLQHGESYVAGVDDDRIAALTGSGRLRSAADYSRVREADVISICVPTPLSKAREPDISAIEAASLEVARNLRGNQLVILESTTYPGTTEEVVKGRIEDAGFEAGKDVFVAYSPERVDPGNKTYTTRNTPKVVGGVTPACTETASAFYSQIVEEIVPVSSPRVAEMSKLLENVFRCVNIALVNELMMLADRMDINIWEVIDAASTKPFGFMPFYPGPGLGGHCIPIDPFYLSWKARQYDFHTEFIELAGKINKTMPYFVDRKITDALNEAGKAVKGAKILVLGLAYKPNIDDVRESPALKIIELLLEQGADVSVHDPHISEVAVSGRTFKSRPLTPGLVRDQDCVVIVTKHDSIDYRVVVDNASLVVDTRNSLKGLDGGNVKLI